MDNAQFNFSSGRPYVMAVASSREALNMVKATAGKVEFGGLEVRLDTIGVFPGWVNELGAIRNSGIPVLLTIRSAAEGGSWNGSESDRLELYRDAIRGEAVSAVDAEIHSDIFSELAGIAANANVKTVGSFHDFEKTPPEDELLNIIRTSRGLGADLAKVAAMINTPADKKLLAKILAQEDAPVCIIGMGDLAADTRIVFPCLGSRLTYGYLDTPSAPGQFSAARLSELLREISPDARVN